MEKLLIKEASDISRECMKLLETSYAQYDEKYYNITNEMQHIKTDISKIVVMIENFNKIVDGIEKRYICKKNEDMNRLSERMVGMIHEKIIKITNGPELYDETKKHQVLTRYNVKLG